MTFVGTHYKQEALAAVAFLKFTGRPSDTEICTINGRIYELDTNAAAANGGQVLVDITGNASVDDDITDLAAAINGDTGQAFRAQADTVNDILWLFAKSLGTAGNALTLTEGFSNCTRSAATFEHGREAAIEQKVIIRHTITTAEATAGIIQRFIPGMTSILSVLFWLEDGGIVDTSIDTTVAVTANILTFTEGSGPAWAAGDVLVVEVTGM